MSHKVHRNGLKTRRWHRQGLQKTCWPLGGHLVLLAHHTSPTESVDVTAHVVPKEPAFDKGVEL